MSLSVTDHRSPAKQSRAQRRDEHVPAGQHQRLSVRATGEGVPKRVAQAGRHSVRIRWRRDRVEAAREQQRRNLRAHRLEQLLLQQADAPLRS